MMSSRTVLQDLNLASRRAEEAAMRRFFAVEWLQTVVGPLGISSQPSENEFISCLRNGLVLCNAINKVHPGAVPKVVENYPHLEPFSRDCQPPPAYQYFENVRNFLVALEDLKLPAFEASDLEKDNLDPGSVAKVVDCILGLKAYHEWKLTSGGNGFYKPMKIPMFQQSATKIHPRSTLISSRNLDMFSISDKLELRDHETHKLEDMIAKLIVDHIVDTKENIDENVASLSNGSENSKRLFRKIISSFVNEKLEQTVPELHSIFKDLLKESNSTPSDLKCMPLEELPVHVESQCHRSCPQNGKCNHKQSLKAQEKKLADLKDLFTKTKQEFKNFQLHLQRDIQELGNQVREMSSAALGYQKVVVENRKLYNMVQDLKGSIRVYCRVRPIFNGKVKSVIEFIGEDGSLTILDPSKPQKDARKMFRFNDVFGATATQDQVFRVTQPLIRSVMDGYNVCIFAYGQTGSGKTYTMSGPPGRSTTDLGINYLALNDLFLISDKRRDIMTYEIHVQMVEIYNEQVRDLLAENSSSTRLEIRSCSSEDGFSLPDATMHSVKSTMDVIRLMEVGEVNRAVSSTSMNNRSSRSHSILTVHVRGKDNGSTLHSCLHLVDLAGSERVDKSEVTGDRLKEAQYINKSLACLGDVISALAQKNSHIPYRNSKLTLLLQDSLGGQAKTLMLAHLSPEEDSFGETISTLKFAQRVSTVELGAARAHKESREVVQLKEQIENLKKALASREGHNASYSRTREIKSPSGRHMATTERTPPRLRRLSIENSSTTKTEKGMNFEEKKGCKTPSVSSHSKRSSLEGPSPLKKEDLPINMEIPNTEAIPRRFGFVGNGDHTMEGYQIKSPTSSHQNRSAKVDGRTSIPQLQLLTTPDRKGVARNELKILTHSELTFSADSRTNGKGSQIRKSLRTIGKLINGSEKRGQQNSVEPRSPLRAENNSNDGKSPHTGNAKTQRRQSLTGIAASGPDRSRRSSLGGKSVETGVNDSRNARNAKTPPPMHQSSRTGKRWL